MKKEKLKRVKQKRSIRNEILKVIDKSKKGLSKVDENGRNYLHKCAEKGYVKHCARLINIDPALKDIEDHDEKKPFKHLNNVQKQKVTNLQNRENKLVSDLHKTPWEVVVKNIESQGMKFDQIKTGNELKKICNDNKLIKPFIKPLFELAKLAALGQHRLSGRVKFKNNQQHEYDSDDDCDEKIHSDHRFSALIDPKSKNVCSIAHFGNDGQAGKDAFGVHIPTEYNQNKIFVAGKRKGNEVIGTFVHELVHFIIREVFEGGNPYAAKDKENRNKFTKIAKDLEKCSNLPETLRNAYSEHYKENNQVHGELIVRLPQIIVSEGWKEFKKIKSKPCIIAFINYYEHVFLDAVIKHTEKLEKTAMGGWPKELFFTKGKVCFLGYSPVSTEDEEEIEQGISKKATEVRVKKRKAEITKSFRNGGAAAGAAGGGGLGFCCANLPGMAFGMFFGGVGGGLAGHAMGKSVADASEVDIRKRVEAEQEIEALKKQVKTLKKSKKENSESISAELLSSNQSMGLFAQLSLLREKEMDSQSKRDRLSNSKQSLNPHRIVNNNKKRRRDEDISGSKQSKSQRVK